MLNGAKRAELSDAQIKGLAILREGALEKIYVTYEVKTNNLLREVKNKAIGPWRMVAEMTELANIIDPLIGDEANAARIEIDHEAVTLTKEVLAKYEQKPIVQQMKV